MLPEIAVTVISNGETATGINCISDYGESFESNGERGITHGKVILDASKLSTPEKGATILVNGISAIVGSTALDAVGAHLTINYQLTTPVTQDS